MSPTFSARGPQSLTQEFKGNGKLRFSASIFLFSGFCKKKRRRRKISVNTGRVIFMPETSSKTIYPVRRWQWDWFITMCFVFHSLRSGRRASISSGTTIGLCEQRGIPLSGQTRSFGFTVRRIGFIISAC